MLEKAVIGLLVFFIIIFAAGLIVYTVFFTINKSYFRRQLKISKKYNQLVNDLNGINIFRFKVLAENDLAKKQEMENYMNIHATLRENAKVIKDNIAVAEEELNRFNLKNAKICIAKVDQTLNIALADMKVLKEAYVSYTQYGYTIDDAFQNYRDIFEVLEFFYVNRIKYHENFKKINDLFASTKKTLETIPNLSLKFDYKRTVETAVDLGHKIKTLSDAILLVMRFQIVDSYLKTTKEQNQDMLDDNSEQIASADLQKLQNLLTLFNHAYEHFRAHYKVLQLGKAQMFALQAIDAISQVNRFTYIHIKTPALISLSLNEIKEQTDKILVNKDSIIESIKDLKQYFVLEPKMTEHFDLIEKNVGYIAMLNDAANHINYKTHTEKIRAIMDLDKISQQIVARKSQIVKSIDAIDDVLGKVVKTITDLNDLYIYYWQLLVTIKKYAPAGAESKDLQNLIKTNLSQLEKYAKDIVSNQDPDFDTVAYEISTIVEQSQQIYTKMTKTVVLKSYASKLFVYANRYKKLKIAGDAYEKADKAYKAKNYALCIEILLKLVKEAKRVKKEKKRK